MKTFRIPLDKKTAAIFLILFVVALSIRVVDIDKPYETWDEITTYSLGLNLWYNIFTGDFTPDTWKTYNPDFSGSLHPPLARYTYGIVNGVYIFSQAGLGLFSSSYDDAVYTMYNLKNLFPGRLLSALLGALTAGVLFLLSRKFLNLKTAIIASLVFSLLPVTIAHTKLESLDAMLMFLFTVTIYFFIKGLESKKYFYLSLLFVGLSIATKYNSVTLFILLPVIYFIYNKPKIISKKQLLLIPFVAVLVLFAIWPRFWPDPIGGALANISGWLAMGGGSVGEYFLGQFELTHPAYYDFVYILVTMPGLLLIFFFAGIVTALKKKEFGNKVFLLWFALPLFVYSLFQFKMGGPRYVIMIYPAIAVLIAIGITRVGDYIKNRRFVKHVHYTFYLLIFIYIIITLIFIHPHYLDYYNEFVGGPANVYENNLFVIGRSGEGIGQAVFYLNNVAEKESSVQLFVMPRHVIPPLREDLNDLTPFKPKYLSDTGDNENWYMTSVPPEADYLVENTFFRRYLNTTFHEVIEENYDLIHTVEIQGAPLAWIYEKNA
ncbi:MAG: glycosyltransferase family 39 protein [Nanoarchaeota archaeon]|nr:glycosyltransferase family 39 protein [Nanoarchaeota archaeon]